MSFHPPSLTSSSITFIFLIVMICPHITSSPSSLTPPNNIIHSLIYSARVYGASATCYTSYHMLQSHLQYPDTQCNTLSPYMSFPTAWASLFYLHPHPPHSLTQGTDQMLSPLFQTFTDLLVKVAVQPLCPHSTYALPLLLNTT